MGAEAGAGLEARLLALAEEAGGERIGLCLEQLSLLHEFDRSRDLKRKVEILSKLRDSATDGELAVHNLHVSLEDLIDRFFQVMSVEMFSCENAEDALEALVELSSCMSESQLYWFFKKSLALACLAPYHNVLWLLQFAKILLERAPWTIIPTFHVNPSLSHAVDQLQLTPELSRLPKTLPGSDAQLKESSLLTKTQQRCALVPAYELVVLLRHVSPAVRTAALDLVNGLGDAEKLLDCKEAQIKSLNTNMQRVVLGGVKRAIRRLDLATELF